MTLVNVLKKIVPNHLRAHPWVQMLRTRVDIHAALSKRLKKQLSLIGESGSQKPFAGKRLLIPIIETSHYQHHHVLAVAKAVQLRGAEVKVLICGEVLDGCEIKSVREEGNIDPCWSCRFNAQHTTPLYELETVTLADFVPASERAQIRAAAAKLVSDGAAIQRCSINLDMAVQDSVIRYYYGAVPRDETQTGKVRQDHSMTALLTAEVARRIDEQWHPDIVFCNMTCYSAWEAFYKYYRDHGKRFRTISLSEFNFNSITFNQFELFGNGNRFLRYVKDRPLPSLTHEEEAELSRFINDRFSGRATIFQKDRYFEIATGSPTVSRLNIQRSKRNIFLFSNIYWDVGLSENGALYTDVISWVLGTIELLKDNSDLHLYIKPHPGEVFGSASSRKGIRQIVRENYPQLPDNVTIIDPEWRIKTYDLFSHIDLGVIFTGTLGLEMMLAGIPVVSTGATTHYGLGFAAEPKTEAEYLGLLLGEKEPPKYNTGDLELFAYFYFIRSKMPWTLTKQAFGDHFDGFVFETLDELLPGKDPQLDHLCNCIMDLEHTVVESWPASTPKKNQDA